MNFVRILFSTENIRGSMSINNNYEIIHISDLHTSDTTDNKRIFKAFIEDLKSQNLGVCTLVISGDITNRGDFSRDQVQRIKERIEEIRNSLPKLMSIVICPGNHDLNLSVLDKAISGLIEKTGTGNEFIAALNEGNKAFYTGHLNDYYRIINELGITISSYKHLHYTVINEHAGKKIGYASIDSAWSAGGKGDLDYGKILVGEEQLDLALDELDNCDIKIAVMLHTPEWISMKEKSKIQNSLSRNFDILLCGHNHHHEVSSTVSNIGQVIVNNTGCLYQSRDYFNGYSIISIDTNTNKGSISSREYYSDRDCFDVSTRFSSNGLSNIELLKKTVIVYPK